MKNKEKYIDDIIEVMRDPSKECRFRARRMFRSKYGECSAEIPCTECNVKFYQWLEEEYEPEVDWKKVPMNTVIEVRDDNYASWNKRVFVFYDEGDDFPFVCISNATASAKAVCWKYARLPEEVKNASYLKEE